MIKNSHNSSHFNSKLKKVFRPRETESFRYDYRKISQDKVREYPDYLQSHRKHIMLDYHHKLDEIRLIKVKLTGKDKDSLTKMTTGRRAKTQRQLDNNQWLQYSDTFLSEPIKITKNKMQKRKNQKMTNKKRQLNAYMKNDSETPQNITPFQRNTIKRLRARQELSMKKKIISQQIYYEGSNKPNFQIHVNPPSFRIFGHMGA